MKANNTRAAKRPSGDAKTGRTPVRSQSVLPKAEKRKRVAAKAVTSTKSLRAKATESGSKLSGSAGKNFLQSSLGAISRSRDDATGAVAEGLGRFAESIGLRKLEDVFDQRVAGALERMGIPTARELARLRERVDLLSRQVEDLKLMQSK